jgi:hypothetical protein
MTVERIFTPAPETVAELQARIAFRNAEGNQASAEGRYADARRHWALAETYLRRAHELIALERAQKKVAA